MNQSELSFEEALSELEDIAEKLETGEISLDETVEYFRRGITLSKICSKHLKNAKQKIVSLSEAESEEEEIE